MDTESKKQQKTLGLILRIRKYGDYKTDKNSQYLREELSKLRKKLKKEREV